MISIIKIKHLLLCLFVVGSLGIYLQATQDEIFKKTVRTKRPNKLKEEIAQTCILCLEYTTELLDIQAQLQQKAQADSYYTSYRVLADIQRALYARVKELAESDKNAYLNQASGRELQDVVMRIDEFIIRNKQILVKLRQHMSDLRAEKIKINTAQLQSDQNILINLLQEEKNFFSSGCKADPKQKNPATIEVKK